MTDATPASSPDDVPWHCSLAFYRGSRAVHVQSPMPSATSSSALPHDGEDLFIIKLHQRLLPSSDVSQPLDHDFVDEHYAKQLASDDGLEWLRVNWCLLLALFFPVGGLPDTAAQDDLADESPTPLTVAQKESRNQATPSLPISSSEACHAGPLTAIENGVMRDPGTLDRVYFSFVVLLRFFGWRVHDEQRGILDRHRGWEERYRLLQAGAGRLTPQDAKSDCDAIETMVQLEETFRGTAPSYDGSFNFYEAAISRIISSLLSVGLVLFAVRLVEFLLEEMASARLLVLLPLVEQRWLPCLEAHVAVDSTHTKRLRKKVYRLTHSDSD